VIILDKNTQEMTDHTEVPPFNSVIDHAQRIEGLPNKRFSIGLMPKFLRFFWFFILGVMGLGLVLLVISAAIQ
jgi:hypothetical protein